MSEEIASLVLNLYEDVGLAYDCFRNGPQEEVDFWDGAVSVLIDLISRLSDEPAEYVLAEIEGAFDGWEFEDRINEIFEGTQWL